MRDMDIQVEPDGLAEEPQPGMPFDDLVILLSQTALSRIREHAEAHLDQEIGGLLVGHLWKGDGVVYVEVKEAVPAQTKGTFGTVQFTAETWLEIEQQREKLFPMYKKVGWYHSHLGLGIFFSPMDEFLHQSAFSLPWQVAFVYDPVVGEYGFFRWHEGKLVPVRFYLAPGDETLRDTPLSQQVGQRLHALAGYLEGLQIHSPITRESERLHSRLEMLTSGNMFGTSLVEDTLSTLVAVSEIEPRALSQAKVVLNRLIGEQLLLDRNVDSVSPLVFDSLAMAILQGRVYFVRGKDLFCAPLSQEHVASVISVPAPIDDVAVNSDSLFALHHHGTVYTVPLSEFERAAAAFDEKSVSTPISVEVEKIVLSSRSDAPFRAITARYGALYLITPQEVWAVNLTESGTLRPRIFNLSKLKGPFPVDAQALAVDEQSNVYIADTANSRVLQMKPDGRIEYAFLGGGSVSLITPTSMCIKGQELYVLDSSVHRIIVYDLKRMAFARRYNYGEFVGDREIRRLYTDDAGCVYFSAGRDGQHLYRMRGWQSFTGADHQEQAG